LGALQVSSSLPAEVTCAVLFLISEVMRERGDFRNGLTPMLAPLSLGSSTSALEKFDDEDEEHYEDVAEDDEVKEEQLGSEDEVSREKKPTFGQKGTWVHRRNLQGDGGGKRLLNAYDPQHRNPAFAGAQYAQLWELRELADHAHPTVSLFARNLLAGQDIAYGGDPLQDFTLTRFFDRFVFRNPKKEPSSTTSKKATEGVFSRKTYYAPTGLKGLAPDSQAYMDADVSSVPTDERFIHRYVVERRQRKEAEKAEEDDDNDSVTSEDFNDYLDNYFKKGGSGGADKDDVDDGDDDELDFANSLGDAKPLDDDVESDEDESGDENERLDGESDEDQAGFEDLQGSSDEDDQRDDEEDEFDEEGFDYSDDEEEDSANQSPASGKRKGASATANKGRKKARLNTGGSGLEGLLASAEEFADMVEEAAVDDIDLGGSEAVSNVKDKAGKRQLKWEAGRHNDVKGGGNGGRKWANKGKGKGKDLKAGRSFKGKKRR
jgi:ribosome biogenesis protein MAK21